MIRAHLPKVLISAILLVILSVCGCGGGGSNVVTQLSAPAITSIAPSALKASALSQTITVTGSGFLSGFTVTVATSSASISPAASAITPTSFQISAVFAAGSYTVSVKNPDGGTSSPFSFTAKAPSGISLASPVNYPTGATTSGAGGGSGSVAIADYNGDGKLDVAVSNYASNTVAVLLNNGDGTLAAPLLTAVDPMGALGLGAIVTGDFNEDGKMDLIVATIAGLQSNIVLLGNGDGTFTDGAAIANTYGFLKARAVDINGDKHLDVISGGNGNLTVALGKGDGTFNPATFAPNGPSPDTYSGIDVGDVKGTGKLDVVAANLSQVGNIVVFPVNADGTLAAPTSQVAPASYPDSVALADFNGDGKLDLLTGYALGSALVALGNGDGTFNLSPIAGIYGSSEQGQGIGVLAADLDLDGKPDALALDYLHGVLTVALNDASSISAGSKHTFTLAKGVNDMQVGDLNGDGIPDIVVVNDDINQISVLLSQN
jgi:hypothetical protein